MSAIIRSSRLISAFLLLFASFVSLATLAEPTYAARKKGNCKEIVKQTTFDEGVEEFEVAHPSSKSVSPTIADAYDRELRKTQIASRQSILAKEAELIEIELKTFDQLKNSSLIGGLSEHWITTFEKTPLRGAADEEIEKEVDEDTEMTESTLPSDEATPTAVLAIKSPEQQIAELESILQSEELVHTDARAIFASARIYLKTVQKLPNSKEVSSEISGLLGQVEKTLQNITGYFNFIVEGNLRLVLSAAAKQRNRLPSGLAFEDLVQEGNMSLMIAAQKFVPRRGYAFSTYGTWWIRQGFTRSRIDKGSMIRIPVHKVEAINRLLRAEDEFRQKNHRFPSTLELAKILAIKESEVIFMYESLSNNKMVSLDAPAYLGEDAEAPLSDYVRDARVVPQAEKASNNQDLRLLRRALEKLSPRDRSVIEGRFGLSALSYDDDATLQEVGRLLGLTRERARQIQEQALVNLRKALIQMDPSLAQKLQVFIKDNREKKLAKSRSRPTMKAFRAERTPK